MHRFILVFFAAAATAHAADEPYDFRGTKLGMSLADFRAMPFPDPDSRALGAGLAKAVKLLCTGDNVAEGYDPVSVARFEKEAGAISCAWMLPPDASRYQFGWEQAYVEVGQYWSSDVEYRFAPSASGDLVLRQIAITLPTKAFQETVEGLRGRFGEPSESVHGEVQNGIGNTFGSNTVAWKNPVSSLVVIERAGTINDMGMVYTNTEVDAAFQAKLSAVKGPPKF